MLSFHTLIARVRALFIKGRLDAVLDEELRAHLEMLKADNIRAGLAPSEAARRARLQLGGIEQIKENVRDERGLQLVESVLQDVCYAFRSFRASPAPALVSIIVLALGIAAATVTFSVVEGVVLRSLPFPGADRLVDIKQIPLELRSRIIGAQPCRLLSSTNSACRKELSKTWRLQKAKNLCSQGWGSPSES